MKNIKPLIFFIVPLCVMEQFIKVLIFNFCYEANMDIIGNLLRFRPIKNTNYTFGGNYIEVFSHLGVAVVINILVFLLFISGYNFYISIKGMAGLGVRLIMVFGLAGAVCSLIDKIIWGGSIDYIQLPGLFTFDLKDCFLTVAEILFLIIALKNSRKFTVVAYLRWCVTRTREIFIRGGRKK